MSSKTRTRTTRTASTATTTGSTATLRSVPDQTTAAKVRTDTEDKLWEALHANPNSTAADLSGVATIGKSTAQKILVRWAADGSVTRTAGIAEGGRRAADLWAITEGDAALVDAAPVDQDDAPADDADATDSGGGDEARLASGALRGMVEDYLRDHPGEQFGPTAIAKELGGKSSGAVSNALDKLVEDGVAVKTQDKPRRFALAPAEVAAGPAPTN